jgi:isopentenyldiphosphate isomerase
MRIPIVNEQDEIIEYIERDDYNSRGIRRVTGLWVTSPEGDILLARRALTKKHHPGVWGPAVSGTVEEGETYESNIIKEAEEEIGLTNFTPIIGLKNRRSTDLGHGFWGQWFTAVIPKDYPLKKQDEEVEELRWFTKSELDNFIKDLPKEFLMNLEEYINIFSKN